MVGKKVVPAPCQAGGRRAFSTLPGVRGRSRTRCFIRAAPLAKRRAGR